jgi:dethiobiotin synthetase
MPGLLLAVTGTGTAVGKTTLAVNLCRLLGEAIPTLGIKPLETGVPAQGPIPGSDIQRLAEASTFHVKLSGALPVRLPYPAAATVASRMAGRPVDPRALALAISEARSAAPLTILETAGGLFSPLSPGVRNQDFLLDLRPDVTLLVAPNRLGVIHDATATYLASAGLGLCPSAVVLNAAQSLDASASTNAEELRRELPCPILGPIPWGDGTIPLAGTRALIMPWVLQRLGLSQVESGHPEAAP